VTKQTTLQKVTELGPVWDISSRGSKLLFIHGNNKISLGEFDLGACPININLVNSISLDSVLLTQYSCSNDGRMDARL